MSAQPTNRINLYPVLRHAVRDDTGLFSLSILPWVLVLTFVAICLLNVGVSLHDRAKLQSTSDTVAESLATLTARYDNVVTCHNHLTGQLLSMVIVHHALGGDLLDEGQPANTQRADSSLRSAYRIARALRYSCPAYPDISSPVLAGAALLDAQLELKSWLTSTYRTLVVAWVLKRIPFTRAAGFVIERITLLLETELHLEWRVLDGLRRVAKSLTPIKRMALTALRIAKQQLDLIVAEYPLVQRRLADQLEEQLRVKIHILPSDRLLPLKEDPLARATRWSTSSADVPRQQIVKVTQLARATFPWVNYNRQPLVSSFKWLSPMSGMSQAYFRHTCLQSLEQFDQLQRDGQLALYVLSDYAGPDKAFELWMEDANMSRADRVFGLTVLVGSKARHPIGAPFFRNPRAEYAYRISSAIVYNRHAPQQPVGRIDLNQGPIVPGNQAQTGFDTLNWDPRQPVVEYSESHLTASFPVINLGWDACLTPTTPARYESLRYEPMPNWATDLHKVLPFTIGQENVGL